MCQSKYIVICSFYFWIISYNISRTSSINISLLYHRKNRTTHSFHTQGFVLCDADELASTGVVGKRETRLICKRGGFTYWSGLLEAGFYVLIPFSTSFWRQDEKHRDFTVVIHSSVQLDLSIKTRPSTFLTDCLISAVMKMSDSKKQVCLFVYFLSTVFLTMISFRKRKLRFI
jgi:hypothetical protein